MIYSAARVSSVRAGWNNDSEYLNGALISRDWPCNEPNHDSLYIGKKVQGKFAFLPFWSSAHCRSRCPLISGLNFNRLTSIFILRIAERKNTKRRTSLDTNIRFYSREKRIKISNRIGNEYPACSEDCILDDARSLFQYVSSLKRLSFFPPRPNIPRNIRFRSRTFNYTFIRTWYFFRPRLCLHWKVDESKPFRIYRTRTKERKKKEKISNLAVFFSLSLSFGPAPLPFSVLVRIIDPLCVLQIEFSLSGSDFSSGDGLKKGQRIEFVKITGGNRREEAFSLVGS